MVHLTCSEGRLHRKRFCFDLLEISQLATPSGFVSLFPLGCKNASAFRAGQQRAPPDVLVRSC
eukprot:1696571-Amphidinium_carterae.1